MKKLIIPKSNFVFAKTVKRQDGFTLIELLVVTAIIGVLASTAWVALGRARIRAMDARRSADIKSIALALELYNFTTGKYPCSGFIESTNVGYMFTLTDADYLGNRPKDPINTYPYVYEYKTYKAKAGGPCGAYAYIGLTYGNIHSECPLGGYVQTVGVLAGRHCHVFIPTWLPPPCNTTAVLEDEGACSLAD